MLEDFITVNIDNVIILFKELNSGAHGLLEYSRRNNWSR